MAGCLAASSDYIFPPDLLGVVGEEPALEIGDDLSAPPLRAGRGEIGDFVRALEDLVVRDANGPEALVGVHAALALVRQLLLI